MVGSRKGDWVMVDAKLLPVDHKGTLVKKRHIVLERTSAQYTVNHIRNGG